MPFQKGHQKIGGRKLGTLNRTKPIKEILADVLPDEEERKHWKKWLTHSDPHIAFEAFKLAQAYQHGKPTQVVEFEAATDLSFSDLAQPDGPGQINQPN